MKARVPQSRKFVDLKMEAFPSPAGHRAAEEEEDEDDGSEESTVSEEDFSVWLDVADHYRDHPPPLSPDVSSPESPQPRTADPHGDSEPADLKPTPRAIVVDLKGQPPVNFASLGDCRVVWRRAGAEQLDAVCLS